MKGGKYAKTLAKVQIRGLFHICIYIYRVQPTPHIWGLLAGLVSKKRKRKKNYKVNLWG